MQRKAYSRTRATEFDERPAVRILFFLAISAAVGVTLSRTFDLAAPVELVLCLACCAVSGLALGLLNWLHFMRKIALRKSRETATSRVHTPRHQDGVSNR